MHWIMRKEFEIAYQKANEVLDKVSINCDEMIRTASIIDAVEKLLGIDVKFSDFDFSQLSNEDKSINFENYGAAMCVSLNGEKRFASILLNEKESPKMKRFSLVHELGHLMTQDFSIADNYQVSTHIDMDITRIPNEVLDRKGFEFLIDEQVANIFALLVLIPYDMLMKELKSGKSIEKVADFFGVETDALVSRLCLEDGVLGAVNG